MKSTDFWDSKHQEIKDHIAVHGVENFLECHALHETMIVHPSTPWIQYELNALTNTTSRYDKNEINGPNHLITPDFLQKTKANTIHQMFHAYMIEDLLNTVDRFDSILEFGGGFGALAHIIRTLGFNGNYTIYDFPELNRIQNYYLDNYYIREDGMPHTFCVSVLEKIQTKYDLLISCFALTESSPELINYFLYEVQWNNIMLVYSKKFCDLENNNYIEELIKNKPDFNFTIWDIPWLPGNSYLFGKK